MASITSCNSPLGSCGEYGMSVFMLDLDAIANLLCEVDQFNATADAKARSQNKKIVGRASWLNARLRGQDKDNGGHFREVISKGTFPEFASKKVMGRSVFPAAS